MGGVGAAGHLVEIMVFWDGKVTPSFERFRVAPYLRFLQVEPEAAGFESGLDAKKSGPSPENPEQQEDFGLTVES